MSNENPGYVNQLVITFESDDRNNVTWTVRADDAVKATMHMDMAELVRAGAPLSALGIRALYDIVCENVLELALQRGNLYQCREWLQNLIEPSADRANGNDSLEGDVPAGVLIH